MWISCVYVSVGGIAQRVKNPTGQGAAQGRVGAVWIRFYPELLFHIVTCWFTKAPRLLKRPTAASMALYCAR